MNILTISILYEIVIIIYVIIYLILILNQEWCSIFKLWNVSLIVSLTLCFIYTLIRMIQNKRNSRLTWHEYLARSTRIDSNESFNTLLSSHKTNKCIPNIEDNKHKESIMSIATDEEDDDDDIICTRSGSKKEDKPRYSGPALHANRYGLPEYIGTPPSMDVVTDTNSPPVSRDDISFHISKIQDNMTFYNQNVRKKRKRKKKKNKDKSKNKNKSKKKTTLSGNTV